MTMTFAAIADYYYLIEREIASTADFLNTCLRESGLSANQVEITDLKPGIDALYLRLVAVCAKYDALKAVEAAARRLKAERDTDAATGANDDALETADAELDEALAALDAIRAQEVAR